MPPELLATDGDDKPARRPRSRSGDHKRRRLGAAGEALSSIVAPCVVVSIVYLLPFVLDRSRPPYGNDTYAYVWRAATVHLGGLSTLSSAPSLGARPGYFVLVAALWALTGAPALTWAWVLPAVVGSSIALAAGALAVDGLKEPRTRAFAYAIGVGASSFVAWTAVGYAANLLVDALAVAAVLVALLIVFDRSHPGAGVLLLAAAAIVHVDFAGLLAGLLLAFTVLLALAWRFPWGEVPAGGVRRLAWTLGLGLVGGLAAVGLSPGVPARLPSVPWAPDAKKMVQRLPSMALPLTVPAALAGGGGALALRPAPQRRWGLVLLLLWTATVLVSLFAWFVLHRPLPPYRWAGFALSVPILVIVAASVLASLIPRSGGTAGRLSSAAAGAAAIALLALGAQVWLTFPSPADPSFHEAATVAAYVERLPASTPIAFVVGPNKGGHIWTDHLKAALPPELLERVTFIPGPTPPSFTTDAPARAVVLRVRSLDAMPVPGTPLGPDVWLLDGPRPTTVASSPTRAPAGATAAVLVLTALAVLGVCGSGWSGLLGVPTLGRIALAPSLGIASLTLCGLIAGRLGFRTDLLMGALLIMVATGSGWLARHRWGRHDPAERTTDLTAVGRGGSGRLAPPHPSADTIRGQ